MRKKPNTARSIWRTLHLIIINVRINRLIQRGRRVRRWRIMIRPPHPHVLHLLLSLLTPSLRGKLPATSSKSFLFPTAQSYHSGPVGFLDCCVCPPLQTVSNTSSSNTLFSVFPYTEESVNLYISFLLTISPLSFFHHSVWLPVFWQCVVFFSRHEDIDWKWLIHIDVATFKYIKPTISSVFYIPKL